MVNDRLVKESTEKIIEFFKKYPVVLYEEGEKVLRPGENSNYMYCVKSGYYRAYMIGESGKEITVSLLNPQQQPFTILGFTPVLDKYFVEAVTPLEMYKAPREDFQEFLDSTPHMLAPMMKYLMNVIKELRNQIEWLTLGNAYARVATILSSLARRYGENTTNGLHIAIKPTHQMLASLAGLSRETVTLQMTELEKKGIISYVGKRLIIKDIEKLKKEAIVTGNETGE